MARPKKFGLDFFPLDVGFFSDTKINRLRVKFGNNGIMIYLVLLCKIYEKGYFIEYDEDVILDVADIVNVSESFTRQVINYLLSRSLFDSTLAMSVKVLTSAAIQRRFQGGKRRSAASVEVDRALWLLKKEETLSSIKVYPDESKCNINSDKCNNNPDKCAKNDNKETRQDKTRLDETRGEKTADKPPTASLKKDIEKIFLSYNEICTSLPKVTAYTDARVRAVKTRLKSGYTVEDFRKVFSMAQKSEFLCGKNDRGWTANFDWLIKDSNIGKVLDGAYQSSSDQEQAKDKSSYSSFDISDLEKIVNGEHRK